MAISTRQRFMWLCAIGGIAAAVSLRSCSGSNVVEFQPVTEDSLTPEQRESLRIERETNPSPTAYMQYQLDADKAEEAAQKAQDGAAPAN